MVDILVRVLLCYGTLEIVSAIIIIIINLWALRLGEEKKEETNHKTKI